MTVSIKFDANQQHQRDAIDSVVELFAGQEGREQGIAHSGFGDERAIAGLNELVFGNSLDLAPETMRANLRRVQDRKVLLDDGTEVPIIPEPDRVHLETGEAPLHFNVEMETGTGKTYVYLRTIAELHQKYGFKKFVIVVPRVAIREGVLNNLDLLRPHIRELYDGLQYDHSVYDGRFPTRVRAFATASHLQIMVVNIDAMTGDKENRIMHRALDSLCGHAPIDFLQACRPVVIMDEPQSLGGPTHGPAIEALQPLFKVGYSATPPTGPHLVYRLTPVDAYNMRLVKRIGVLSITKDADLNEAHIELHRVTPTSSGVTATATINKSTKQGTKPTRVTLRKDDDLWEISGLDQYRGWVVEDIHASSETVEFQNGQRIAAGATNSDADEQHQRLLLREAVEAHFAKELQLEQQHRRGVIPSPIKPLTLFFIERVADYAPSDSRLRSWFEEEYQAVRSLGTYRALTMPDTADVHDGYFAIDSKGAAKDARAESKDAADAFERIMQNKQALLSFDEPLRFIFSHSALAEGWDNPNVFTICNLQEVKSKIKRRQQVGRGLRLPVMADGERCRVEEINVLTVLARESFTKFAAALQKEIEDETGVKFDGRIVNLRKTRSLALKDAELASPAFRKLWDKIAARTTYQLDFRTDDVVANALERIADMPEVEPVKFRRSHELVSVSGTGVAGEGHHSRGEVAVDSASRMPDVVGELCRRVPISRATIVRILKDCRRLDEAKLNPAVFVDQLGDAINRALYAQATEGIVYHPTGESWDASLVKARHQSETVAPRVVAVQNSITDHVVCDSEVEQKFAEFLDARSDVPLFIKLPGWFKVETPLGNYNPDWAFVKDGGIGGRVYLVRETKGTVDIDALQWETEGWKIRFGMAHFEAIGVDYAFGHDPNKLISPTLAPVIPLRIFDEGEVDPSERFARYLPLYSLKAAAGGFSASQEVEPEGWVAADGQLAEDMFIAQVVGTSMEPTISSGSYCVFQFAKPGSRQGQIVLAQHRDVDDPETGGSYTVKEYQSSYQIDEDGQRTGEVVLMPHNSEHDPIVLTADGGIKPTIIATFVRIHQQS